MRLEILGSGQDDGVPHTGCYCDVCNRARKYVEYKRFGPSMTIFDKRKSLCYLIDASPDFKHQLDMIHREIHKTKRSGKIPVDGIMLTHAHLGHCAGLWHLGKESVEERNLPVFCTSKMKRFLCDNYPFNRLVQRENIKIEEICSNEHFHVDGLTFMPTEVPHRNEIGDTVGYIIKSEKKVVYLPDIDRWTENIVKEIQSCDVAFVDGTFYSKDEISRFEEVPHPPIPETISLLENVETEIFFTHINHTNPVNKEGREREFVESRAFKIAYDGLMLEI